MSIASGKEKYARNTGPGSKGEAKYNAAKATMPAEWNAGLAAAGQAPGPISQAAYQAGIAGAQFRGSSGDKWERNYRRGISR